MHGAFHVPPATLNKAECDLLFGIDFTFDSSVAASLPYMTKLLTYGRHRRYILASGGDLGLVRTNNGFAELAALSFESRPYFDRFAIVELRARAEQAHLQNPLSPTNGRNVNTTSKGVAGIPVPAQGVNDPESTSMDPVVGSNPLLLKCNANPPDPVQNENRERSRDTNVEAFLEKASQRKRKKSRERRRFAAKKDAKILRKKGIKRSVEKHAKLPSHLKCRKCKSFLPRAWFSGAQRRKAYRRKCRACVRQP